MRPIIQILATLLIFAPLTGCVVAIGNGADWDEERNWEDRQKDNAAYVRRLELGRRFDIVAADLGDADFEDTFQRDGETYRVLYFRTRRLHEDGRTTRDETTPLVFVDGLLVGWGDAAIENATR